MASINGITLKGLRKIPGHDGIPCFSGNLYVDGTKIGSWAQDTWNGPDAIVIHHLRRDSLLKKEI